MLYVNHAHRLGGIRAIALEVYGARALWDTSTVMLLLVHVLVLRY